MPVPAYLWLTDSDGNEIEGSVQIEGREKSIEILAFSHEVRTPTDKDTGAVTATRKHESVKVAKAFDKSSPILYKGVCDGDNFKTAIIKWYKINDKGEEVEYFRHELEGVTVSSVKPIMYNVKDPAKERYVHLEEVALTYQKISWFFEDGVTQHTDSWQVKV